MKKKMVIDQYEQVIFRVAIILNMKVTVILQLNNILIKLNHI